MLPQEGALKEMPKRKKKVMRKNQMVSDLSHYLPLKMLNNVAVSRLIKGDDKNHRRVIGLEKFFKRETSTK